MADPLIDAMEAEAARLEQTIAADTRRLRALCAAISAMDGRVADSGEIVVKRRAPNIRPTDAQIAEADRMMQNGEAWGKISERTGLNTGLIVYYQKLGRIYKRQPGDKGARSERRGATP